MAPNGRIGTGRGQSRPSAASRRAALTGGRDTYDRMGGNGGVLLVDEALHECEYARIARVWTQLVRLLQCQIE